MVWLRGLDIIIHLAERSPKGRESLVLLSAGRDDLKLSAEEVGPNADMSSPMRLTFLLRTLLPIFIALLCFSSVLCSQVLGSEALTFFPPDTQQVAYADLSQLRTLPSYKRLRQALFSQGMRNLESFLQSTGDDPEVDVDEVVVGWRAGAMNVSEAFGLAEGSFDSSQLETLAAKGNLASREYAGYTLIDYGNEHSDDVFVAYLSTNLVAFGRLDDLERLIDDYLGRQPSLKSNSEFANWEAGLEGSGAQWGITTGSAAAQIAVPWLGVNSKSPIPLGGLFKTVKAVLYKVSWSGDFDAQISIVCDNAQDAQTLERLVRLWQGVLARAPRGSALISQFVSGLQLSTDDKRLELEGSGPPELINEILVGGGR